MKLDSYQKKCPYCKCLMIIPRWTYCDKKICWKLHQRQRHLNKLAAPQRTTSVEIS